MMSEVRRNVMVIQVRNPLKESERTFLKSLCRVGVQDCRVRIGTQREETHNQRQDEDSGTGAAGFGFYICHCDT